LLAKQKESRVRLYLSLRPELAAKIDELADRLSMDRSATATWALAVGVSTFLGGLDAAQKKAEALNTPEGEEVEADMTRHLEEAIGQKLT
jgi:predicted transcriptional regulator